ncbi:MAG: hypothetical protein CMK94_04435 [Pseudomonas sp.]|nr:hypothetical protein [Pseudomonas sp.]
MATTGSQGLAVLYCIGTLRKKARINNTDQQGAVPGRHAIMDVRIQSAEPRFGGGFLFRAAVT